MILDLELSEEDMERLENGGFFIAYLNGGIKVVITKEEKSDE